MESEVDSGGSARRNWISLGLLFLVNLLNYMDRYTISAVLDPFRKEMCGQGETCSNTKVGLVQTAFVVVYLTAAPLFGFLGDRYSRKYIMVVGVLLWAGCSLTATFMPSFWPFLAVRALIGVGESAFTTIAPTVIGDLFSGRQRSLVYGMFYMAIPFGTGIGFGVGGAPGEEAWRWGLRITPCLTLGAAILLLLFLYDPPRGESEGKTVQNKSSYFDDLRYIARVKSFVLNAAGFTCVTFTTGSLAFYAPLYFTAGIKSLELSNCSNSPGWQEDYTSPVQESSVPFYFGMDVCFGGLMGVTCGMLLSRYLRPKYQWIDPVICGASLLVSLPLLILGVWLTKNHIVLSLAVIAVGMIFLNFNWSVAVDMTIYVITPARRATAEAVHLMLTHALGEAGAPFIVGAVADAVNHSLKTNLDYCPDYIDYLSFQYAMFLPFGLLLLGGILFLIATKYVTIDKLAVENEVDVEL